MSETIDMNNDENTGSSEDNAELNANSGAESAQVKPVGDAVRQQIEALENQVKEKENKYLYLYADFENYKKRAVKERSDLIKFGWESVARDLLQTLDNLELALSHAPPATDKNLLDGLTMVLKHFQSTVQKQGVQSIESLNKMFDPNLHEALSQEPSDSPSGTILKEHSRGYTLHGRLLRPARVVVSA